MWAQLTRPRLLVKPVSSQLVDAGALWHLLPPLFKYDYTLAEGGVQASSESNRQEVGRPAWLATKCPRQRTRSLTAALLSSVPCLGAPPPLQSANANAVLAFQALARLGGYLPRTEESLPEVLPSFVKKPAADATAGMAVAVRGAAIPGAPEPAVPAAAPSAAAIEEWKKCVGCFAAPACADVRALTRHSSFRRWVGWRVGGAPSRDRYLDGVEMETPVNHRVREALRVLLTPYLCKQLSNRDAAAGLKLLNRCEPRRFTTWGWLVAPLTHVDWTSLVSGGRAGQQLGDAAAHLEQRHSRRAGRLCPVAPGGRAQGRGDAGEPRGRLCLQRHQARGIHVGR